MNKLNDKKCCLCRSELHVLIKNISDPETGHCFSVLRCTKCGLKVTYPHPEKIGNYYKKDYHGGRHGFSATIRAKLRFKLVRKLHPGHAKRSLLDIGCGDGLFLFVAKEQGWDVAGTELFPDRHNYGGLNVVQSIDEISKSTLFDVITLWHSLEHMHDPEWVLNKIKKYLKPGGILIISVPDSSGWQAKIFKENWLHYDVPRHLWHFDITSLRCILLKCRFHVFNKWHQEFEYDLMGWVQSFLDLVMPARRVFWDILMGKGKKYNSRMIFVNILLGCACSFLFVLPVFAGKLAGKNGTIVVAARGLGHTNEVL